MRWDDKFMLKDIEDNFDKKINLLDRSFDRQIHNIQENIEVINNKLEFCLDDQDDFEERVGKLEDSLEGIESCRKDHDRRIESLCQSVTILEKIERDVSKDIGKQLHDLSTKLTKLTYLLGRVDGLENKVDNMDRHYDKRIDVLWKKIESDENINKKIEPISINLDNYIKNPPDGTVFIPSHRYKIEAYIAVNNKWYYLRKLSYRLLAVDKKDYIFNVMDFPYKSAQEILSHRDEIIKSIKERESKYDDK